MKTKTKVIIISTAVLLLSLVMVGTALAGSYLNIPLNNDTAEQGTDCPTTGGPYWHFVISPNNADSYFITFHLNLGDAATYDTSIFVPNGNQLDNVFVAVPGGKLLTSLIKTGSSADIYWNGDSPEPTKFQLSHVCGGVEATPPTVFKDAAGTYTKTFAWDIAKQVNPVLIKQAGVDATLTYTVTVTPDAGTVSDVKVNGEITITNPNPAPVVFDSVVDQLSDGTVCSVVPVDSLHFLYECVLAGLPAAPVDNIVTVTWSEQLVGGAHLAAGSASYTVPVSFSGNSIDECVSVSDPLDPQSPRLFCVGDAEMSFSYQRPITGVPGECKDFDNTATFTTNDTGSTGSGSTTATLCVGVDLQVSKTVIPSFTRTYQWDITKDVDKTYVRQVGGSATFNYTVYAFQTGFEDSEWAASGVITITNPNKWEDITLSSLTDVVDNGGACTILDAGPYVVPMNGSIGVNYTCTFPTGAAGTNTATATWDKDAYYTPNGSASGSASFAFVTPTKVVDKVVTVTDSFAGVLGTLTATDAEPWASGTYTYSRSISVPSWNCLSYDNTAKVLNDKEVVLASDSETVTVCGPLKTGALTMGFWQNKNGQALIKNAGSGIFGCSVGVYLKQYAPFQDLPALATCNQVATYVTNVIKAANASGSSMNAMLKAQMLATALDDYFFHIGSYKIDLTYVKAGGGYQDVSAAFGGATSMTISDMLTYAASKSNVGGSMWYGNVKSMQELAKNAFDAINNQWVFGAP